MQCAALHDHLMCRAQRSCSSTTLAMPLGTDKARGVPPHPRVGNGRRVNLLGTLAARLLGKPICIIEFKCRSLDTLSSGGRHFHVKPFNQTLARSHQSQACRSSDFTFANELERSTVTEGWEHVGPLPFQRVPADTPRPPVVGNSAQETGLESCLLRLCMSRVRRMDGGGRL